MAVSVNLGKGLDKAWENKTLDEILAAPPSALAGLTEKHDAAARRRPRTSRRSPTWAATSTSRWPVALVALGGQAGLTPVRRRFSRTWHRGRAALTHCRP